ncbi:MAG: hypothetical protein R2780_03290 [Crocinitomicaceae bacterium]|nr:hypothetical protein [Crocinitomicaceae bacterium]
MVRNLLIIILSSVVLVGCRKAVKNPEDILPKVETVDVYVNNNNTLVIIGEVLSEGTTELYYLGGCFNTEGNPDMLDNQQMNAAFDGQYFSVEYPNVNPAAVGPFYFRVWAANESTYSYGSIIKIDSLVHPEVNAPCTPTTNTIDIGDGWGEKTVSYVTSPANVTFSAEASNVDLEFQFATAPSTFEYTTTTNTPSSSQVRIKVTVGSVIEYVDAGNTVYVNKTGTNNWNIVLCDASWVLFSSTVYINADINYPL